MAGDGEPTTFKDFGAALEIVEKLRRRYGLDQGPEPVQPVVLTNATMLHRERVQLVVCHAMGFRAECRGCLYVDHVGYQFCKRGTSGRLDRPIRGGAKYNS